MDEREVLARANRFLPFPVLDAVSLGETGKALKYVSAGEAYFAAHFPEEPILPGVLIMGALIAVGSAMCDAGLGGPGVKRIRRFRFHRPVRPGDVLELAVRTIGSTEEGIWFAGTASVDGELVARGRFLL
jgi:3-hydroxyacyl-[acyl-carrier-protein] dehydratase